MKSAWWPALLLLALVPLLTAACGGNEASPPREDAATATTPPASAPEDDATPPSAAARIPFAGGARTVDGGSVSVQITWDGNPAPLQFEVAMDTHSVDLDRYNLSELSALRNSRGEELRPVAWEAPKGGHHREGTLLFAEAAGFVSGSSYIELAVRDVAGVGERLFRWDLVDAPAG